MKRQTIKSVNGKILYQADCSTFLECLEQAVAENIKLSKADLKHKNLSNASLDCAQLETADFTGSNLTGTNLSEADLQGAKFIHCDLYNTCFSQSRLTHADFSGASFGGTLINGADMSHCKFNTLEVFKLDFHSVQTMENCLFRATDGTTSTMSAPPKVIIGLHPKPIIIFERETRLGHEKIDRRNWIGLMTSAEGKETLKAI